MPHSTESTQCSSSVTSRPASGNPSQWPPHPLLPLQLGRLTGQLHNLHSSSTHSLNAVTCSNNQKQNHDSLASGVRSLQDLNKFTDEDTSLDLYIQPSVSITKEGKGIFQELFLPPPILPQPSIKKKKAALQLGSQNSSSNGRDKSPKTGSRTPSPNLHKSRSNTPTNPSQSRSDLKDFTLTQSHSSLHSPPLRSHTTSTKSMGEVEEQSSIQEAPTMVSSQSKAAQKLLQKRAKFCTPGNAMVCYAVLIVLLLWLLHSSRIRILCLLSHTIFPYYMYVHSHTHPHTLTLTGTYILTITEVTTPPFLGKLLPPLHIEVRVVPSKTRTPAVSRQVSRLH